MTNKNNPEPEGVDILYGMSQAFFIWILRPSKDDDYIAKCFRDILNYFVLYKAPPEYLGGFMINALQERHIVIADLRKLEAVLIKSNEKPENIQTVSYLIKQAEQYLATLH